MLRRFRICSRLVRCFCGNQVCEETSPFDSVFMPNTLTDSIGVRSFESFQHLCSEPYFEEREDCEFVSSAAETLSRVIWLNC